MEQSFGTWNSRYGKSLLHFESMSNRSQLAYQVKIGCCTVDILKHLSGEEMSRNPKDGAITDRISRLANHILTQQRHVVVICLHRNLFTLILLPWMTKIYIVFKFNSFCILKQLLSSISTGRGGPIGFLTCSRSSSYLCNSRYSDPTFRHEVLCEGKWTCQLPPCWTTQNVCITLTRLGLLHAPCHYESKGRICWILTFGTGSVPHGRRWRRRASEVHLCESRKTGKGRRRGYFCRA